jgi:metal-responsive CopG/Arc/MetJ family transcriptional regulator
MKNKIAITIDEELLQLAKQQADKEKRSLSNLINIAVEKYLEAAKK